MHGLRVLLAVPAPWPSMFKDAAVSQRCVAETLDGTLDLIQVRPLRKLLSFWKVGVEISASCGFSRQDSYVSSLAYETRHLPIWSGCLFCLSVLALRVRGQFQISPQEALELAN